MDLNIPLYAENAKDEIAKIYKIFLWNPMMKMMTKLNEILTTITSLNDDFTWKCFIQIFIRNIRETYFKNQCLREMIVLIFFNDILLLYY